MGKGRYQLIKALSNHINAPVRFSFRAPVNAEEGKYAVNPLKVRSSKAVQFENCRVKHFQVNSLFKIVSQ